MATTLASCCCGTCADCVAAKDTLDVTIADWVSIVGQTGGDFVTPGCLRAFGGPPYKNYRITSGDLNGSYTANKGSPPSDTSCTSPLHECFYSFTVPLGVTEAIDNSFSSTCDSAGTINTYDTAIIEITRLCPGSWLVYGYVDAGTGPSPGFSGTPVVDLFRGTSADPCDAAEVSNEYTVFVDGATPFTTLGKDGTLTLTMP